MPARPVLPSAGRSSAETLPHGVLAACLFALATVSALKGLHRAVAPEVLYFYYTDYEFGFILRGLVGQVFSPLLRATQPETHAKIMVVWHVVSLAALLAALSHCAARLVTQVGRTDILAMMVLLFCSPLVPSLAFFIAAPDILLCLLSLWGVMAMRKGLLIPSWLLFLLGTIIHQLMVFIALPVIVMAALLQEDRQRPAMAGTLAVGVLACMIVLMAPPADVRFIQRFVELGISPEGARDLYDFQLHQSFTDILEKMGLIWRVHFLNGMISLAYGATVSVVILAIGLRRLEVVRRALARLLSLQNGQWLTLLAGFLVVGTGLGPLADLALAWDFSRLAVLSTFTSFLVTYLLFQSHEDEPLRSSTTFAWGCGVLAVALLVLPMLALWPAGMKLNDELPIIRNPVMDIPIMETAIRRFRTFYDRDSLQPVRVDD